MTESKSPWSDVAREGIQLGGGDPPLLILAAPGSLPIECAKEIHSKVGGGQFEVVRCTPDPVEFRTLLFGSAYGDSSDVLLFDSDLPVGAVHRANGGTLYLESVDRCHSESAAWLPLLLSGQPVELGGYSVLLDSSTRVIASVTSEWMDRIEQLVPAWILASFGNRVHTLQPLSDRPNDLSAAIEWFHLEVPSTLGTKPRLTTDVKILLQNYQWPGDLLEMRTVIRALLSAELGDVVTVQLCERILDNHQSQGMTAIDGNRRLYCRTYAKGITYIGRPIEPRDLHEWISQFTRVSPDERIDPWSIGLRIVREIAERYYYSADNMRFLIREAYLSLCRELVENGYLEDSAMPATGIAPPSPPAVLVNPLGPLKSPSSFMPHMARLLGAGHRQGTVLVHEAADYLAS